MRTIKIIFATFLILLVTQFFTNTTLIAQGNTIFLKNMKTDRYALSSGEKLVENGKISGTWIGNPEIVGSDANYYGRAEWVVIPVTNTDYFQLRNKVTNRYLLCPNKKMTGTRGSDGNWIQNKNIIGADANYYNRANWRIIKNGNTGTYQIINVTTNLMLLSPGKKPTKAEGSWLNSPPLVGSDANYYNRCLWYISGNGLNVIGTGSKDVSPTIIPKDEPVANSKVENIETNALYRLTNSFLKDNRSLDVNRSSNAAFMGTTGNYNGQQWYFKSLGGNKYSIHDDYGRVLDVAKAKSFPSMSVWGNYTGQYWTITKQSNDYYRITDAYGRALDTNGGGKNEPMVVAVVNVTGQFWKLTKVGTKAKMVSTNLKNWMSSIKDNTSIAALSIPGTHDSGADYGCPTFAYDEYAKCHTLSIPQQLNSGIRYLDIRCRRTGNSFSIHHGQCYQQMNFGEVLRDCQKFLRDNPSETIIMRIKEEHTANSDKSFATIFSGYENSYSNLFYTGNSIPAMSSARGKIVILDNASIGKGVNYRNQNNQDKYYFSDKTKKWSPIKAQLDAAKNSSSNTYFYLNHISATAFSSDAGDLISGFFGGVDSPKDFANYCNPKVSTYFDSNRTGRFGIIIMDFPTQDLILQIIKTNGSNVVK